MAGITAAFTNQAKQDFFNGVHQPADVYKIALYRSATATLDKTTTAYTTTGEAVGTGYTAGGVVLTGFTVSISGDTAYLTFANATWAAATLSAEGAMLYNSSRSNKALAILDFGGTITSTADVFTVQMPAAGLTAIMRIA